MGKKGAVPDVPVLTAKVTQPPYCAFASSPKALAVGARLLMLTHQLCDPIFSFLSFFQDRVLGMRCGRCSLTLEVVVPSSDSAGNVPAPHAAFWRSPVHHQLLRLAPHREAAACPPTTSSSRPARSGTVVVVVPATCWGDL